MTAIPGSDRADFTMSQLQDGDVLIAGGDSGTAPISSVEKFSLVANHFQYFGTLTTAAIAMMIAVPVGLGISIFLTELCPQPLRRPRTR